MEGIGYGQIAATAENDSNASNWNKGRFRPMKRKQDRFDLPRSADPNQRVPQLSEEDQLKLLIVKLGDRDNNSSLEESLDSIAEIISDQFQDNKQMILDLLFECGTTIPAKTEIYGTLVGLLNLSNEEITYYIVQKLTAELQNSLDKIDFIHSKVALRYIGSLFNANAISSNSVMNLLNQFMNAFPYNSNQSKKSDFYVHLVMITLPWISEKLSSQMETEFNALWDKIDNYIKNRTQVSPLLSPFELSKDEKIIDEIESLWIRLVDFKNDKWNTVSMLRPFIHFSDKLEGAERQHNIGEIKIQQDIQLNKYPIVGVPFSLKGLAIATTTSLDRELTHNYVTDTICFFQENMEECAKQITGNLPPSNSMNQDGQAIILEAIYNDLFRLPNPIMKDICYSNLLTKICASRQQYVIWNSDVIQFLFKELEKTDIEVIDRFTGIFSQYLGSQHWEWLLWFTWENALSLGDESFTAYFLRESLEKSLRLSYYEKISKMVNNEKFHKFLPEKPEPYLKHKTDKEMDGIEYSVLSDKLLDLFRQKKSGDEIKSEFFDGEAMAGLGNQEKIEVLMYSILQYGTSSLTHFIIIIERCLPIFNDLVIDIESRVHVIKSVREFWKNSQHKIIIYIDRLMTLCVIDNISIVHWIFSINEQSNFVRGYLWDILRNTINKTIARTNAVKKELSIAQEELNKIPKAQQTDDSLEVQRVDDWLSASDIAVQEQNNLFNVVFNKFCTVISERSSEEADSFWMKMVVGRFREFGRRYHNEISQVDLSVNAKMDTRLTEIFEQIKML